MTVTGGIFMRFDQCTNGNIFMHGWTKEQAVMSEHDKAILQELAKKMAGYAARPEQDDEAVA